MSQSKPEKPVEYRSFAEVIPVYVKSCYAYAGKCEKHYSWDGTKFVPYNRDLPIGIHIRPVGGGVKPVQLTKYIDISGLEFAYLNNLEFEIEMNAGDRVVAEKFSIPIYEHVVTGWKNDKQAWAIAYSTIKRYNLDKVADWIIFPHYYSAKKAKWDKMLIIALPKDVVEKIDKWVHDKILELMSTKIQQVQTPTTTQKTEAKEVEEEEISVEELEKMLQQIEKGKETITVVPSPAPTAVPSAQEVELPPPPTPSRSELVKIYELIMRLPSKYLVQQSKYVKTETGGVVEQRVWEGLAQQVASRLEGIRRTAYDKIRQLGSFGYVKEFEKWIGVTDKAVKDAEEVSKWIREELGKLPLKQLRPDLDIDKLYTAKAIEVYLKPEDAKLLLETAIAELEEAKQELERRIQEAEQEKKKSAIKKLEQELTYTKQVLEQFKKFLQQLETRSATIEQTATQQQQGQKKQRKAVAVTA
jgi:hypothetical protein